jgi:ferritin-like metal-binding protein YciE
MPLDTLANVLTHELSDLYSAESQFAKALLQVAKNANSDEVRNMALEHHAETQSQIDNLKQAFASLGTKKESLVCKAAQGLVEENSSTLKEEKPKGVIKDVVLIAGCLRIEHYEIAGYSAAISLAKTVGNRQVVQLLQANLKQEKETARKLEAAGAQFIAQANSAESGDAPAVAASTSAAAPVRQKPGPKPGAKSGAAKGSNAKASNAKASGAKASSANSSSAAPVRQKPGPKPGAAKAGAAKAGGSKAGSAASGNGGGRGARAASPTAGRNAAKKSAPKATGKGAGRGRKAAR